MRRLVLTAMMALLLCCCDLASPQAPKQPTANAALELCNRLNQIRIIPYEDEKVDDEVYNKIISLGSAAAPCLIDQITNEAKMDDPRQEPSDMNFRVGDMAFLLLFGVTQVKEEDVLPKHLIHRMSGNEGMYAYFDWVSHHANRVELQQRFRTWLKNQSSKGSGPPLAQPKK
jgi:hypothetical protein